MFYGRIEIIYASVWFIVLITNGLSRYSLELSMYFFLNFKDLNKYMYLSYISSLCILHNIFSNVRFTCVWLYFIKATREFRNQLAGFSDRVWLRPDKDILERPGGQLIHCFSAHKSDVDMLDMTTDGKFALTGKTFVMACIIHFLVLAIRNFSLPVQNYKM